MVNYSNVRFIFLDPLKQHKHTHTQKKRTTSSNKKIKDVKDGVCVYLVYEMKHLTHLCCHYTIHDVTWEVNVCYICSTSKNI